MPPSIPHLSACPRVGGEAPLPKGSCADADRSGPNGFVGSHVLHLGTMTMLRYAIHTWKIRANALSTWSKMDSQLLIVKQSRRLWPVFLLISLKLVVYDSQTSILRLPIGLCDFLQTVLIYLSYILVDLGSYAVCRRSQGHVWSAALYFSVMLFLAGLLHGCCRRRCV